MPAQCLRSPNLIASGMDGTNVMPGMGDGAVSALVGGGVLVPLLPCQR